MKLTLFSGNTLAVCALCVGLVFANASANASANDASAVQEGAQGAVQEGAVQDGAVPESVPEFAGDVTLEEWKAYSAWFETLPPEQKDWEVLLQKHLGSSFYFPRYLKGRINGSYSLENPGDWGFVEDDPALPRVLLIGDSISRSCTSLIRQELKGVANVHRAPTNCGSAENIVKKFNDWRPEVVRNETKRWDVIYFNAGIHDRSRGAEEYERNLRELVQLLKRQGAILIFARTTPCRDRENALESYRQFNEIAEKVMAENDVQVDPIDLEVKDRLDEFQTEDRVHFNEKGQRALAAKSAATIRRVVEELNAETAKYEPCPTPQRITRKEWIDYMKFVEGLPEEQQKWEQLHIKYDGYHGLLWYLRPRLAGAYSPENPGIWGMVKDDPALPRVMLIGDSISLGYTTPVRKALEGKANVHRPPCNCGPTVSGLRGLDDWLGDGKWDVIQFNFGLHDRRRSLDEYLSNLQKLVDRLKETGAVLIFANTTPCTNEEDLIGRVEEMNAAAEELMRKNGVIVNDFYALLAPDYEKLVNQDKCHYSAAGSEIMAKATVEAIEKSLPKK